ncbi:hypothetical protein QO004_004789 [Rhizobium mesoamericanum]|nr:hypothetical protein [Rhizobium mesoamericanum]
MPMTGGRITTTGDATAFTHLIALAILDCAFPLVIGGTKPDQAGGSRPRRKVVAHHQSPRGTPSISAPLVMLASAAKKIFSRHKSVS